ncbi:MAG: hypothetical protein PVF07_11330 [Thiogranum sp.]|jgi:hypothetical protein
MTKITTNEAFRKALGSLTLAQQRTVSARFIENVLDLAHESCIKQAQSILGMIGQLSAEDLEKAYHSVHSVYVHTYPHSDLSPLDYRQQAEHFVAEACVHCLAPTYYGAKMHHLAERVATYCIMARTCASIDHEGDYPKFTGTEELVKKEVYAQYEILGKYLDSI